MFYMDPGNSGSESSSESQVERVARRTARTVPWIMGTLAAGMREQGEGLHPSQLKLLMSMHHAPVSPTELAERMEVSMPTISKTLDVLERRGLVERAADEADRRRVVLTMTQDGRSTLSRVLSRGIEQLSESLSSATPEELERIEQGMKSLSDVFTRAHPEHKGRHCKRPAQEGDATT